MNEYIMKNWLKIKWKENRWNSQNETYKIVYANGNSIFRCFSRMTIFFIILLISQPFYTQTSSVDWPIYYNYMIIRFIWMGRKVLKVPLLVTW